MEYLTYNEEHFVYFQIKEEKSSTNANLDWRGQTSAGEKVHSSKKTPASPDCFSSTVWNENTFLLLQETERVRPHWWRVRHETVLAPPTDAIKTFVLELLQKNAASCTNTDNWLTDWLISVCWTIFSLSFILHIPDSYLHTLDNPSHFSSWYMQHQSSIMKRPCTGSDWKWVCSGAGVLNIW